MKRELFIAGQGAVSGFGVGAGPLLEAVFAGGSALRERRRLAAVDCAAQVAGEVSDEILRRAGSEQELPFWMALRAAEEALFDLDSARRRDTGLVVATTKADQSGIHLPGEGLGNPGRLSARLAAALELAGPRAAVSCACASGLSAIALAGRWIGSGRLDRVLVVGVDGLSEFILRGFGGLQALDPEACRPFDRERSGLSLGEAAAALLLVSDADEAGSRAVQVAGFGESNDAHHATGPDPEGGGLERAARRALEMAGIGMGETDLIHLHGTGTPYNDAMEGQALGRLFGRRTPPAFGTKAQTGHTLGAAGVMETLIVCEALQHGVVPANVNLEEPDVHPDLNLTTAPVHLHRSRTALKVSSGFGGITAALVVSR